MSWIQALCETYDNYYAGEPLTDPHPLIPVGFIEKELDIRINLLSDGTFHSASVLEGKEKLPVPSSPAAEGKTGSSAIAYPLCDDLRYTAGDLSSYTDSNYSAYYSAYVEQLRAWCDADDAPPELSTLLTYLDRKCVVSDLINCGIMFLDDGGKILTKWTDKKNKPALFRVKQDIERCVVDFAVQRGAAFVPLREIEAVRHSWQNRLLSGLPAKQLCYSSGEQEPAIYNHAKIEGNAKLISSKDGPRDFQFKGRFKSAEQAYSVSYLTSSKAHSALRWLRDRQGFRRYGVTFIAWSTTCRPIIAPQDDADDGWGAEDEDDSKVFPQTEQAYAVKIRNVMAGLIAAPAYSKGAHIVMLGMEAATPGRMSINYYQELDGSEYLERLALWYTRCMWHLFRTRTSDGKRVSYVTTPTLKELEGAVFGTKNMRVAALDVKAKKAITKQIRSFNLEILSCIANGKTVPLTAARTAFRRACRPESFSANGKWDREDWLKCLTVACAMQKSSYEKEEFQVSLNLESRDTSYLFGRLLAVADCAESKAMAGSDSAYRQTNAVRYFSSVQQRPATTWQVVENRLQPYLAKLKGGAAYYKKLLDEIYTGFEDGEIAANKALSPHFLEGYHCQRYAILNKINNK